MNGADGPFKSGLNKANATNGETAASDTSSNLRPKQTLREMLYQNRLYKNNTK
jgi:hypothetical protein